MQRAGDLPADADDTPDGYTNLARIDQGGFAVVYRALDVRFDRTVALKILQSERLDDPALRRFNSECLATGRVSCHPNIVTVFAAGTTVGHRPWLAMEYCPGGSLANKVARQGPLPVAEVISIGVRLCSALSAAHRAGILHRDVKPHNVLLTSYGEPALTDFGIASVRTGPGRAGETADERDEEAGDQPLAYTVLHAAPEILDGEAGTVASDLYSLGSTLYTLLTGQAPFARPAGAGLAPLVTRILQGDPPVITRPGVPPELEQLLRRSMAGQPDDRPASAAELGANLAALGNRLAADEAPRPFAPAPDHADTPTRSRTRAAASAPSARRLLGALGAVLGVLLALFTTVGFGLHGAQPREAAEPRLAADRYEPTGLAIAQGQHRGELIVTWRMPVRPDVVATVIYEGAGAARPRVIVSYTGGRQPLPRATLDGLSGGQRVCLSAAHVVSIDNRVTNVASRPVCAVPR